MSLSPYLTEFPHENSHIREEEPDEPAFLEHNQGSVAAPIDAKKGQENDHTGAQCTPDSQLKCDTTPLSPKPREFVSLPHNKHTAGGSQHLQEIWRDKINGVGGGLDRPKRCARCWLRQNERFSDCYCAEFDERSRFYREYENDSRSGVAAKRAQSIQEVDIVMYMAPRELGRSPNTAHVYQNLVPYACRTVIYGQADDEQQLLREIVSEHRAFEEMGAPLRTCILYPGSGAQSLSTWLIAQRKRREEAGDKHQETKGGNSVGPAEAAASDGPRGGPSEQLRPFRFIALDGTYADARCMFKYLQRSLLANGIEQEHIPLCQLDLGEEGLVSAIAGVMVQPSKDKICTMQAVTLALSAAGESSESILQLQSDLSHWVENLMTKRIKMGKVKNKMPQDFDQSNKDAYSALRKDRRAAYETARDAWRVGATSGEAEKAPNATTDYTEAPGNSCYCQ